ncbi:MAG: hypothetical protein P8Y97_21250 [Candidatus Lokiarchaeota archaeon]
MKCSICGKETDIIAWACIETDDDDDSVYLNYEYLCYECWKEMTEK